MTEFAPQLKLLAHPLQVQSFLAGDWAAAPVNVEISPTNWCNAACPWCLVAGTMIDTPFGSRRVETINEGDSVFGPDGVVCRVTRVGSRYVDEVITIRCEDRQLVLSAEHPLLSSTGWKNAGDFRIGDSTVVRVRVRNTCRSNETTLEQVLPVESRGSRQEAVERAKRENVHEDEEKQSDEERRCQSEGLKIIERASRPSVSRAQKEASGRQQDQNEVEPEPDEKSYHGVEDFVEDSESKSLEIRGEVQRVGSASRTSTSAYRTGRHLGSSKVSGLSSQMAEESHRVDSRHGVHSERREPSADSGQLRTIEDQSLPLREVAVSSSISTEESISFARAEASDRGLRISGIELERGLALRRIDSVLTVKGRIRVYNLACEPSESYEANGFVVHNCFYVGGEYKQRHSRDEILSEVLAKALNEMADRGVKTVTWTGGGDPSTYSSIDWVTRVAEMRELRQGMFTNGYAPIPSPHRMDWIRITVTEKFTITKHVAEYAKHTKVGVNFNLCAENEGYLPTMVKQARDAGVKYFQVRPALADRADLQQPVECPTWLKEFETPEFRIVLTEYKWDDYLKPHGYDKCYGHHLVPFLWHNGDVSVCAYHFGRDAYKLGNVVTDGGWDAVWRGQRRKEMVGDGVPVIPACQHNCKNHEINKALVVVRGGLDDGDFL